MEINVDEFDAKEKELKELQEEIIKLNQEIQMKMEVYKGKCRELFGFADGDTLNSLQVFSAVRKLFFK